MLLDLRVYPDEATPDVARSTRVGPGLIANGAQAGGRSGAGAYGKTAGPAVREGRRRIARRTRLAATTRTSER
ncbi:hypothetical protein [Streptomyces sp. CB00455]|uniref:hypothetical protein n=1 Tax=Streptomyces sp. CB00455 TaxID=1703927 RepID=UPI000A41963A|nr:hypothetical protein [Streptomyces sp. CB00455]